MSFKLTLEIGEDGNTKVDFDGNINHMVLIGALENVKHSVLRTVEIQALQANMSELEAAAALEQKENEDGEEDQ